MNRHALNDDTDALMEKLLLIDRPILHQEGHSVREIYQDFYALVGETFADRGYKYRKSKHDMYKRSGIFSINLDYQTFSWNAIGDNIDVTIDMRICYQQPNGEEGWFFVYAINNQENEVSNIFDLKDISKEQLSKLVNAIGQYLDYMERLIEMFQKGKLIDMKSQQLTDPYSQYEYEKTPTSMSTTEWAQMPWYDQYTQKSIENVYRNFYKYMQEAHGDMNKTNKQCIRK